MATGHSSMSPENCASQSFNQDHIDDLLAHYAGLSQGSHEGRGFPPLRSQAQEEVPEYTRGQESPRHFSAAANPYPPAPVRLETGGNIASTSWNDLRETAADQAPSNYPTTAAEVLDILPLKLAYLSGGRDKEGLPIITFPSPPKSYVYNRDDVRRLVQYLATIPTEEVRQGGLCIILDARTSNWHTSKHILRTLQEALPGQIQVVYIVQPAHFWSKRKVTHGHNKEKGKLEFSTIMVPDTKLTRYIEPNQLTEDVGGFLPYNHEQWIKLRQDLEHFISSFNALMEHNSRVEQQLKLDQPVQDLESAEDVLSRHTMLQDQFKKAPQSAVREANDLLRSLEQGRDVAGTSSVTPDKINAVAVIKKLLDNITRRQQQLDDLWRVKKTSLEQALQLQVFEKSMLKVRNWLKTRGEETLASWTDIGNSQESARAVQEQHTRFEAKATSILNNLTQLRRMADRLNGSNHFAADSLQRQVAKVSNRFSRFEEQLAERGKIVEASVAAHTSSAEWSSRCKEASGLFKEEATASDLAMVEQLLGEHLERMQLLGELSSRASSNASNLLRLLESVNSSSGSESQLAQATKTGPKYTTAIDHVRHLLENVEGLRKRLYELAEARKLRLEQYKQLFLCERDADQVIVVMVDMLNQVTSAAGEVGNSLQGVLRLLEEHCKFSDTAKKTYKYACDLLSTAQRSRRALRMDTQVNDTLLSNVNTTWEGLSDALGRGQACLEMSQQFHAILEEVLACYIRWTMPINQMPRSSEFVERLSQEILNSREEWQYKSEKCLQLGRALLGYLQQPHPQPHPQADDVLKRSLAYIRYRIEEVEVRAREAPQVLDYHLGVLRDFATYCGFELGIEQVLTWLQSQGLKTIQSLPRLGDTESAVREQLANFDKFNNTCTELTKQVQQLHAQSAQTEALIRCFNSELVRKATSLKTVWEKFLARVGEWHDTLHAALKLYELIGGLHTLLGELQPSLSSEALSRQDRGLEAYLGALTVQRQKLLSLAASLPLTKSALMKHQSVEHSMDTVASIDKQLKVIEAKKANVEELWLNATRQLENEKMKMSRQLDINGLVKSREGTGDKSEKEELSLAVTKGKPVVEAGDQSVQTGDKPKVELLVKTGDQAIEQPLVKAEDQSNEHLVQPGDQSNGEAMGSKITALVRTAVKQGLDTGEGVRKHSLGSKTVEKPKSKAYLKATLSNDCLDRAGDKAKKDTELCAQLCSRTHKVLEWLEVECDGFLANNTQMGDRLETAEKLKTLYERFLESIQPSCLELSQAISELLSLKNSSPPVAQSVGETCTRVRDSVGKRRKELQERIEILQAFVSFCTLSQEIESNMNKMNDLFGRNLDPDSTLDSAQPLLDEYSLIDKVVVETYPRCKGQGDKFMGMASPLLTRKGGSKLAVSSACAYTAVQLGEIEGRYQLMLQGWEDKEVTLKQIVEWQSFRSTAEQLTNWLSDPDTFLSNQMEFGTSAATAEDLLMEHDEFETGAQRIASEVEALLLLSEKYLSSPRQHVAAAGLRRSAQELRALHNSFKAQVSARHQGLLKSVAFFQGVEKLTCDMENTMKLVGEGNDSHCLLRLPSALARHAALTREGEALVKMAASLLSREPRNRSQPSGTSDSSEQVVRRTLEGLKGKLDQYKEVMEERQSSPSSQGGKQLSGGVKRQVSELVIQQKTSSPVQGRKEGVSVASSPLQNRKEGVSVASSPLQNRKEGVVVASSPLQNRKEGVVVASPPQGRKEGAVVASPPQGRKEGVSVTSSPLHVRKDTPTAKDLLSTQVKEISAILDGKTCATLMGTKFSVSLTVPPKTSFSTMVAMDLHVQVPRPLQSTSPSLLKTSDPNTVPTVTTKETLHSSMRLSESSGSPQKSSLASKFKPTLTKRHSLDSGLTSEDGSFERSQREHTPPSGKVSSLRSMFNAMSMSTPPPQPQTLTQSSRAQSIPLPQPQTLSEERAKSTPPPTRFYSPDIIPMGRSSPNHAPPRPPSPVDYNPNGDGSGLLESDCDSLSTFASSADGEREEEEELVMGVEETDNDGHGQTEPKKGRSSGLVLSELKHTEQRYLKSLSVMAEGYLPRFSDQHLPTFLTGKREAIFANVDQIYNLHRNLSQVFADTGSSVLDVCQGFISNAEGFSCYVPFLSNLPRGLALLSEYGGTFFEECQQELCDGMTLEDHCVQPRERVIEYLTLFGEMLVCAEKECLHAVAAIKDVLGIIHRVARAVDNVMAAGSLKDCPFAVRPEEVVRRELFHVYKSTKKKKLKEVLVVLHHDHVIFSQPEPKASWREVTSCCQFVDSLDVHSLMLIETYKRRKERFALSNHLGSAENTFVLQHVLKDPMVKQLWIRDICRLLGTTPVEALPDLGEQHELLPLFFRTSPHPSGKDSQDVSRNGSMKRRDSKGKSSLKRKTSGRDVALARRDSKNRTRLDDEVNIQLGTFQSGVFHIAKQPANENMYVVVQPYRSRRDSFLSVSEGQLVEVLESSGPNWLVMTVARPGELEAEGLLPASCLKRVGEGLQNSESGHLVALQDKNDNVEYPKGVLSSQPAEITHYYVKENIDPQTTPGLRLVAGQSVELLDSSDARWWLVRNRDTMEEGMVAPSCLGRFPPSKLDGTSSADDLISPSDKKVPSASFDSYEPPEDVHRTPEGVLSEISSPIKAPTPCSASEMSLKRTTPIPDLSITTPSALARHAAQGVFGFTQPRPLWKSRRSMSYPDLCDGQAEVLVSLERKKRASTHSLPGSMAALTPLLGQADIVMTKGGLCFSAARPSGLQELVLDPSRVEISVHGERDSVYVAVAGFEPSEKSTIPLTEGQEVKILDASRPDWWLVHCLNTSKEGWVPAGYLKQRDVLLSDDMYRFPFLAAASGRSTPEVLTPQKGSMTYVATADHSAEQEGQLSLTKGQRVHIVDCRRSDWWLCSTSSPDQGITGWTRPQNLIPCINISEDGTQPSKSTVPLCVALADCLATDLGTIDIREGEVLEVIDNSRHDWCLVRRTTFREPSEGWVRTSFIRDCSKEGSSNGGVHGVPWHSRTGSYESDTSEQNESQLSMCLSPETNIEPYEDESQRKEAMERRECVLTELLKTEKEYVEKLEYCIENYWRPMGEPSQPKALRAAQDVIFGNLLDIYTFHHDTFQHKLIKCQGEPLLLGDTFVEAQDSLRMYVSYCQSKSHALEAYREFISYFEDMRSQIKGRLELPDYLILPVQRITKYTLLLQDFQKYSTRAGVPAGKIELALDVTRGISASANAAIHLSMLEGQDKLDLGPLILQDTFGIQEGPKSFKERRAFLFKKGLVTTRRRRDSSEKESYVIKDQLLLSDISITQDMDKAKKNFIIYHMTTGTKFTLKATSSSVKAAWLQKAGELIKEMKGARPARPKSASESFERRSSFMAKNSLSLKREASQRKQSLKAMKVAQANEELAPPGTKYVVMECIVMEGGDDVTLEPGDEVELVRMDGSGSLRVKTLDDSHPIEGSVPGNYLRRKDSVITGVTMAAAPRFTMNLSNLHLLYGTTATISCAFNGYPPPTVCWKHDDEPIQANTSRIKVNSCGTSSVLELVSLDYEDMGYYTCYITNSMGSVLTSMALSVYGPPSQPPKPTVSNIHSSSVKLRWGAPTFDGTSPVTSYEIESLQEGFGEWHQIAQNSRNSYVVKTLEQNTSYVFRIVALNEYGASKPSEQSDCVVTKTKGWLVSSPSIHKKPVHPELGRDATDFGYDECDDGINGAFSSSFPDSNPNTSPVPTGSSTRISRQESFVNHYAILQEELGRGHFGIVYKCIDRQTNQSCAAKHVRVRTKRKAEIRSEVDILKAVAGISPHIIELQGAFEKDRVLHIITELVPDGELLDFIIAENSLTERVAVYYISQLLKGLQAIHRLNIAHLDIEPENLMLSGPVLKIIDFGSARECKIPGTVSISNPLPAEFVAPEVVTQEPAAPAMDMWSVGVITYVLLTGISPFFADNLHMTTERIREARYSLDDPVFDQVSPEAKDFISSLLQKSPEQRLSASRALQHIWIKMLNTGGSDMVSSSPWPMPHLDIYQLKNFVTRRKRQTMVSAVDTNYVFGQRINSSLLSPSPMESEEVVLAAPVLWGGPSDLKLTALVGSSLSIEWHFGGTPMPSVVWEHDQARVIPSERLATRTEGEVASLTITDVVRSDEGSYMCCAMNSVGTEARKVQVTVQDKPRPPTAITAIRLSGSSALVSWQPPSDTGNASICGYTLERQQVGLGTWESATGEEALQAVAHIVENLSPEATYLFRVAAINQAGVSPFSEPANLLLKADNCDSENSTLDEAGYSQDSVKEVSFDTLYEIKQAISCGAFSVVSKCVQRTTGATFAAKCVSFSLGEEVVMQQFQIHQQSTHTRIVALVESFETDRDITMILEYLPGGNLAGHVIEKTILTELETSRFTRQALEGLHYLHKSGIIHSNLRPDNILLNGVRTELKLTDFRLSRSVTPNNQFEAVPVDPDFMAPEAVELKPLTPAADIWSVGVLILFMLLGKSPLLGSNNKETVANIRTCQWYKRKNEMTNVSLACKDFLIEKALTRNPRRRALAPECLTYQWLRPQSVSSFIHSNALSQDSTASSSLRQYSLSQDI